MAADEYPTLDPLELDLRQPDGALRARPGASVTERLPSPSPPPACRAGERAVTADRRAEVTANGLATALLAGAWRRRDRIAAIEP